MEAVRKAARIPTLHAKRYSAPSLNYVYHPKLKTIEADKQTLIWTKTHQIDALPACIACKMENGDLESWRNLVSSSVVQPKGYENSETDRVDRKYVYGILPNLLRSLFAIYPSSMKDKHVTWNGFLSANWTRDDRRYSIRGRPGVIIASRHALPQFFSRELVDSSVNSSLPSTWPVDATADLNVHEEVGDRTSIGTDVTTNFPHLNTVVVAYNESLRDMHILQRGLCATFARLLSEANMRQFEGETSSNQHPISSPDAKSTPHPLPLSGQCIVTNGKKFTFLYLQLNTLDLDSDEGVKNLVHMEGPHLLYSKVVKKGKTKLLTNLTDHVVKLLVSTLING